MKAGITARAVEAPSQFEARFLKGGICELSYTENSHEVTVKTKGEEERTEYEYTLYEDIEKVATYEELVSAFVSLKYTTGDEIALMRKGMSDATNEEYVAYVSYVEACKTYAKTVEI